MGLHQGAERTLHCFHRHGTNGHGGRKSVGLGRTRPDPRGHIARMYRPRRMAYLYQNRVEYIADPPHRSRKPRHLVDISGWLHRIQHRCPGCIGGKCPRRSSGCLLRIRHWGRQRYYMDDRLSSVHHRFQHLDHIRHCPAGRKTRIDRRRIDLSLRVAAGTPGPIRRANRFRRDRLGLVRSL